MKERKALSRETLRRYRRSDRRAKTKILDEFVAATELNRKYAIQLLKGTLSERPRQLGSAAAGTSRRATGRALSWMLKRLWAMFGFMCGKRLACAIRVNLAVLERFQELQGLSSATGKDCCTSAPPPSTVCWRGNTRSCVSKVARTLARAACARV